MAWCHRCRVEYRHRLDSCPECRTALIEARPPERRLSNAFADPRDVVVATLPPEQALVVSERLDLGGVPNSLRDAPTPASPEGDAVHVLVSPGLATKARAVLAGRRRPRRPNLMTFLFLITAASIFLSAALVLSRWFLTGSPLP